MIPGAALFRDDAVKAYLEGGYSPTVADIPPPVLSRVLPLSLAAVFAFLFLAARCRVDITSTGLGIVRSEGGVQLILAKAPSKVRAVECKPGDEVAPNQPLVRFDLGEVRHSLMETEQRIAQLEKRLAHLDTVRQTHNHSVARLLQSRIHNVQRQRRSHGLSLHRLEDQRQRTRLLLSEGLATPGDLAGVEEQIETTIRNQAALSNEVLRAKQEQEASLLSQEADRIRLTTELDGLLAHRESLLVAQQEETVPAPKRGSIESVMVQPGDTVLAGSPLAKLVEADGPLRAVGLIAEKDRAFLTKGATVRIELRQLPASEFGSFRGRVRRIATDLLSAQEFKDTFGEPHGLEGPMYKVDIDILEEEAFQRLKAYIRPSSLLEVRYQIRTQALLPWVFDPIFRYFQ